MGKTSVSTPTPPAAPTSTQTAQDYASALPIYYQTALQYEPQMAQLQKSINEQLYPNTAGLQESLAAQSAEGIQGMPDWAKQSMSDQLKSQFGSNVVFNPLGQQQYGLGMLQANENWKQYYQNMGLSLAGRQPLAGGVNLAANYTPTSQMSSTNQNYGTYSNAYTNMYGQNAQMASQGNPWANLAGTIGGGMLGSLGGSYLGALGNKWGSNG